MVSVRTNVAKIVSDAKSPSSAWINATKATTQADIACITAPGYGYDVARTRRDSNEITIDIGGLYYEEGIKFSDANLYAEALKSLREAERWWSKDPDMLAHNTYCDELYWHIGIACYALGMPKQGEVAVWKSRKAQAEYQQFTEELGGNADLRPYNF